MIPALTREDRRRAVLAAMAAEGVDRLVVASTGLHMIDVPNPLMHLTGYRSVGPAFAALHGDGRVEALVMPQDDAERAAAFFGGAVRASDDGADVPDWLAATRHTATVGFDALPHRLAGALRARLGDGATGFDAVFDRITAPKLGEEIAAARRATEIAEAGYTRMKQWARPGMRECDLAVTLNLSMKDEGADDCFLMLNSAPRSDGIQPSGERKMAPGDLILVELSPCVEGQFSQICRTMVIGEPTDQLAAGYGLLVQAMRAGIAEVRPGVRMSAVCGAVNDLLSEAGYAQYSRPPFIKRRGHGLGGGSVYPGDVAVDNDTVLEAGMVFIVHPNQFLPETGYMMCGEPLVVGDQGAEVLSRREARLDVVGA